MKFLQEKQSGLYQDLLNSNKNGIDKLSELQIKCEDTTMMLQRQVQINEELNDNIHKLKDLNREMEYAWSQKYETSTRDKDLLIAALKDNHERTLTMLRHDFEKKI